MCKKRNKGRSKGTKNQMTFNLYLAPYTKLNINHRPKCKTYSYKLSKRNHRRNSLCLGLNKDFSDAISKHYPPKEK
jgi:hypothetical protein